MSLEAVRRLAWTAIILFIVAIVFAFNHGPILAWLAANHTPLLVGLLQSPLWLVAFLLIVLGLQCWLSIVDDDETPFAIGMHALGIMLGIGWWAGLAALSSHQPADANCYGLLGRLHPFRLVRMDHGPAPEGGQGGVSEAARPDSRLRGHVHRQRRVSEEQRGTANDG